MFRSRVFMQAAAAGPRQPVSQAMVAASQGVSRVLGGKNERFAMAQDYKTIAAKSKVEGTTAVAQLGAALALNRHGLLDEVLEITTPLMANPGNNGQLIRAARSLKTRSLGAKLEAARTAALVSGASTEDKVSSITTEIQKEFSELTKLNADFGAKLGYAEHLLGGVTESHGTVEAFDAAFESLNLASGEAGKGVAQLTASPAAVLTQLLRYQSGLNIVNEATTGVVNNKTIQLLLKSDSAVTSQVKEALAGYKALLQDSSLTDNEVMILATVQASIETDHHHFDFFDNADGDHKLWSNEFCTPFANQLNSFANPEQGFATGKTALVGRVAEISKPSSGFYGKTAALEAALEEKEGDVLDNVLAACGQAPANALATGEESYFAVTSTLDKYVQNHPSLGHGNDATWSFLVKLQQNAIEQLAFRATVGKAVALERQNKLSEALTALDVVVEENRYLHMWKALLARGRTHRALGNIDQAEADFKTLHSLKTQAGYDIPQLDEHRYKSIF